MEWVIVALLAVQLVALVALIYVVRYEPGKGLQVDPNAALIAASAELVKQVQHERSQLVDSLIARSVGDYDRLSRMAKLADQPPPRTKEQREIDTWEQTFAARMAEQLDAQGDNGQPVGLDGNI